MMSWAHLPQYQMMAAYAAPAGWAGQWPPVQPPVVAPPAPPGIDPRRWRSGQWQFNTTFQPAAAVPVQAWAPHPSWGPAVANFNPYKRVPNRGDAAYWATKLSDNPLGLTDMIPADELAKQHQQETGAPHTPWVWVPKDLEDNDGRNAPSAASEQPSHHSRAQHSHHHRPSQAEAVSSASASGSRAQAQPHAHNQVQARPQATAPPSRPDGRTTNQIPYALNDNRDDRDLQASSLSSLSSAPSAVSTFSQYADQQQQQQQQRRHTTVPESRPAANTNGSTASMQARTQTADSAHAFSSAQELKPTFSPKIVRTPDYYSGVSSASAAAAAAMDPSQSSRRAVQDESTLDSTPKRRSSRDERPRDSPSARRLKDRHNSSDDDSPPLGPRTHGRIYGPPTPTGTPTRTASGTSTTTTASTRPSAPSLSGSMSSLSISTATTDLSAPNQGLLLPTFSEEPLDLLSPLVVAGIPPATPEKTGSKELSRSQTYPQLPASSQTTPFPPIPEEPTLSGQLSRTPSTRTPKRSPSQHPRTPSSVSRSRTYPSLENAAIEPVIPPYPASNSHTVSHSASLMRNPLPPPPKDLISSTSTSAASQYSGPRASPQRRSSDNPSHGYSHSSSAYPSAYPSASHAQESSSVSTAAQSYPGTRKRYGYWNKRGDHLVIVKAPSYSPNSSPQKEKDRPYIVYAPHDQANPEDLSAYPAPTVGWMDHHGRNIRYDPNIPELPESLPQRGEQPVRPYQSFVRYTYT